MRLKKSGEAPSEGGGGVGPGTYEARVIDITRTTSGNGSPQLELSLELEVNGSWKKKKAWVPLGTAWRVDQLLNALSPEDDEVDMEELIGRSCRVVVEEHEWQGKFSNRVEKFGYSRPSSRRGAGFAVRRKRSQYDDEGGGVGGHPHDPEMRRREAPRRPNSDSDDQGFEESVGGRQEQRGKRYDQGRDEGRKEPRQRPRPETQPDDEVPF